VHHAERDPTAQSHERMAAGFMVAHFLTQLVGGLFGAAIFVGLGGAVAILGAVEKELGALAFGGMFSGFGVLIGIVLLVNAIPAALAAWGMWRGSVWRQIAAIAAAGLAITQFPVGTLFAIGTLWCTWQGHEAQKKADAR